MKLTYTELVEKLNRVIHVSREAGIARKDEQIEGILNYAKEKGDRRSPEKIVLDTLNSSACEVAIAEALGGHCNNAIFNKYDPSTYAWDVTVAGSFFEIKWMSLESKWYSFNEELIEKVEKRKKYYDRIIVATNIPTKNGWNVYPRLIIDPTRGFHTGDEGYIKESKYDDYKSYYYNHYNSSCVILNKQNISRAKNDLQREKISV
jgi:hypothetical protein